MDEGDLSHIIALIEKGRLPQKFASGDHVFFQGEHPNNLYVITTGRAVAISTTRDGQTIWLEEFSAGDILGIEIFSSEQELNYEIRAHTKLDVYALPRGRFLEAMMKSEDLTSKVLSLLANRMSNLNERIIEAKTLSAKGRICSELKRRSKPIGIDPGKFIVRPTPIFTEFAFRVGSTRETVSRTISDLSKQGILIRKTGALLIPELSRLEANIN